MDSGEEDNKVIQLRALPRLEEVDDDDTEEAPEQEPPVVSDEVREALLALADDLRTEITNNQVRGVLILTLDGEGEAGAVHILGMEDVPAATFMMEKIKMALVLHAVEEEDDG